LSGRRRFDTNGQHPPPADPPDEDRPRADPPDRPFDFFSELKRRKVYRVGAAYLAVAFAVLEGADLAFPALGLGPGVYNLLVLASLLGFPLAVALAWTFDVTGGTIQRTAPGGTTGTIAEADRWVRLKAALVGAGFVAVIFLGVRLWQGPAMGDAGGVVPTERPVLAVLPFQDLSPGGDQEYFADGLHEELLHQLATLQGLGLVSRTSVMHFRGSSSKVGDIADSLGATYVLEGSVRRAVDSVRVTVQLIPAESDEHLWSESYTRALSMDGLFDLQQTLAMRVARSLGGTLTVGQTEGPGNAPTRSLEAYNAFLRGLHHWNNMSREGWEEAEDDFQHAIMLDPEFGQAHAMLAMTYILQNNAGIRRRGELFPLIREHTALAMRYAPDQAESHMAQASVHYSLEWDWEAARREFETTVALDPQREAWKWALAEWEGIVAGDTERALEILDDALRLNPFAAPAGSLRAGVLHFGRRYAEAADEYQKLRAVDPANPTNTMNLVSNLALAGQMEEARRLMDEALPRIRGTYGPTLAVHLVRVGELGEARSVYEEVAARRAAGASISASGMAAAALAVGNGDEALNWLERAFEEEGGIYTLRDPLWDPIRNDPRFQVLWDRVGLPGEPPPVPEG
jgi:TolB-like protein/Flp pilus assembly protein TadD